MRAHKLVQYSLHPPTKRCVQTPGIASLRSPSCHWETLRFPDALLPPAVVIGRCASVAPLSSSSPPSATTRTPASGNVWRERTAAKSAPPCGAVRIQTAMRWARFEIHPDGLLLRPVFVAASLPCRHWRWRAHWRDPAPRVHCRGGLVNNCCAHRGAPNVHCRSPCGTHANFS